MANRLFFLLFPIIMIFFQNLVKGQILDTAMWVTDGQVLAIERHENKIYVGGDFNYFGPNTGGAGIIKSNGNLIPEYLKIEGTVWAVTSDGNGGWYIGGSFNFINGVPRNNIAHIKSDYSLDLSWDPASNGTIREIEKVNNKLYIGGNFTSIGGQTRNNLAVLDSATGSGLPWNPNVNGGVYSIEVSNDTVFVAGYFSQVGNITKNNIAAINSTSGLTYTWYVNVTFGAINAMELYNGRLYIAGTFNQVNTLLKPYLASLNSFDGKLTTWNPTVNNSIYSMDIQNNIVYISGTFTSISGTPRGFAGAIPVDSNSPTSWNPALNGTAYSVRVYGDSILVGGGFTSVNGINKSRIALFSNNTGSLINWNVNIPHNNVFSGFIDHKNIFVGGEFTSIGGVWRKKLASFDLQVWKATDWAPEANGVVRSLMIVRDTAYVAGEFTQINSQTRNRLASVNINSGVLSSWDPNADNTVRSIVKSGDIIYAGGDFTSIGGVTRNRIAAINSNTGNLTSWNPNISNSVHCLLINSGLIYAGGSFGKVGMFTRSGIAAINPQTGLANSWNPSVIGTVYSMVMSGNKIYICGTISQVNGQFRNRLAKLDITKNAPDPMWIGINNEVYSIALYNRHLFIGGVFSSVDGQPRNFLASIDTLTNALTSWNPNPLGTVYTVISTGNNLYVGGNIYRASSKSVGIGLASYDPKKIFTNRVSGNIFLDSNKNCMRDASESTFVSWEVKAEEINLNCYSDEQGNYSILLDTGNYRLKEIIPLNDFNSYYQTCNGTPHYSLQINSENNVLEDFNFSNGLVSINPEKSTVCVNDTLLVNFASGYPPHWNYIWNFNGGSIIDGAGTGPYKVNWNSPGLMNVSLTVSYNGFTYFTQTLPVVVNENPFVPTIIQNQDTLISSALTGNQWFLEDAIIGGAQNQKYVPGDSGTYLVKVTDNGCSSSSSPFLFVPKGPITGVKKNTLKDNIYYYPNPSSGKIHLHLYFLNSDYLEIKVYDSKGVEVYIDKIWTINGNYSCVLNLNTSPGFYYIQFATNKEFLIEPLVIE